MTGIKRLSPRQSRKVNTLVKKECCNCENGNCILLDDGDTCVCPQLISYSLLCKWFRIAVLPLDKLLYAELYHTDDMRKCTVCGTSFASNVKQRQILPGLPKANYPQTGSRAHEKKAYSCYAVGAKKAFDCRAFRTQKQRGKGLIPLPLKSRFYCVTFQKLHL